MSELSFYFDFQSPYSFLSWKWLLQNRQKLEEKGFKLKLYPLSMGSLIASYETKGPAEIIPKRNFLFKQALRRAKKLDITFKTPYKLPFNPVQVLRLGLYESAEKFQWEVVDILFEGIWVKVLDMEDQSVLEKELTDKLGAQSAQHILAQVNSPISRKALKSNLKQAKEKGVFGVPSLVMGDELFWGHDALDSFESYLDGEDDLDSSQYSLFLKLFES